MRTIPKSVLGENLTSHFTLEWWSLRSIDAPVTMREEDSSMDLGHEAATACEMLRRPMTL